MSTLLEIETAAAHLPPAEQDALMEYLSNLRAARRTPPNISNQQEWAARLAALADSITVGPQTPAQTIVSDLRGD